MAEAALLEVSDLAIAYRSAARGWAPAVEGVSFTLNAGETLALVGESGSGKSSIAMAALRLLPARSVRLSGRIAFGGEDLLTVSEARLRDLRGGEIGFIFQEPMTSLNPVLTVGEQICEVLIRHRGLGKEAAMAEAVALLRRVRIPAPESRVFDYPHRMSGGMRQRVMIAMAIACKPRLLIADEPTTALDVTVQAQILSLLKTLQAEEGMAILFITHDLAVVAEMADRAVVMKDGKVVEAGPAAALLTAPRSAYARALLAAVPRFGALKALEHPQRFADPLEHPPAAADPGPTVLRVEGLSTRYEVKGRGPGAVSGQVHAVEQASFELAEGETLALVGESGCGKSSLGRSLMRLETPVSGRVELAGEEMLGLGSAQLRARRPLMQMVFQDPFGSLNPRLTIGQAITDPLRINGLVRRSEAPARAEALLAQVELSPDLAGRYPDELSGGQRQRVCIARALGFMPKVIIADEAVSALDASTKAQIVDLMIDLQRRMGLGYLFISHDMALVERISHRVAVMYLGEIVEIGPRREVLGAPRHPYTRRLLKGVPILDPARRHAPPELASFEIPSPLRPPGYAPPARLWQEFGKGHRAQIADPADWPE